MDGSSVHRLLLLLTRDHRSLADRNGILCRANWRRSV
jgi:hypothetical protein